MVKQTTQPTGLILDEPYSNGLVAKAVQSGLGEITSESDYTRGILAKARNPKVVQIALEMLLVYDKVYCAPWFDNVDYNPLMKLGLVEPAPTPWLSLNVDVDFARSIKALLLAHMRKKGLKITAIQFDELLPEINDMTMGAIVELAKQLQPAIEKIMRVTHDNTNDSEESFSPYAMFSEQIKAARKRTPAEIALARGLQGSHQHMKNLIEASRQLNVPTLTNIKRAPKLNRGLPPQVFDPKTEVAVANYLQESLLLPRISSIEDVLRLRHDPHIHHFRAKIFEWSEKLQTGQLGTEEAIRREIRDANEAIKQLGKWKTASMWTTYISIPLDYLGFLLQLPLTSLITTPIGTFLETHNRLKERRYHWLLLGR